MVWFRPGRPRPVPFWSPGGKWYPTWGLNDPLEMFRYLWLSISSVHGVNSLVSSKFSAEDDATTNLPGSSTLFDNFPPLLMSSGVFRHATDEQLFLRFSSFRYHQLDCHLILCNAVEKYLFIIHQFICQLSWALSRKIGLILMKLLE